MGVITSFLKLLKPGENDYYNEQTEQAENWQKIDDWAQEKDAEIKGKENSFSKNSGFNLDISHVVDSVSKTLVASAFAVKTAYDKAVEAIGLANTNKNAIENNTEQIGNLNERKFLYNVLNATGNLKDTITLTENLWNFSEVEITVGEYVSDNAIKTVSTLGINIGEGLQFEYLDNNIGTAGTDGTRNVGVIKILSNTTLQIVYHSVDGVPKETSSYFRIKKVIGKCRIR